MAKLQASLRERQEQRRISNAASSDSQDVVGEFYLPLLFKIQFLNRLSPIPCADHPSRVLEMEVYAN